MERSVDPEKLKIYLEKVKNFAIKHGYDKIIERLNSNFTAEYFEFITIIFHHHEVDERYVKLIHEK